MGESKLLYETSNYTGDGLDFEDHIAAILRQSGYSDKKGDRYFIRQAQVGKNLFQKNWRCDFLIYSPKYSEGLIAECKLQRVGGTTEEKLVYLVETVKQGTLPAIIIADIPGASSGAQQWLFGQTGGNLVQIFTSQSFIEAIEEGFLE